MHGVRNKNIFAGFPHCSMTHEAKNAEKNQNNKWSRIATVNYSLMTLVCTKKSKIPHTFIQELSC
jgi:hypothetical protein